MFDVVVRVSGAGEADEVRDGSGRRESSEETRRRGRERERVGAVEEEEEVGDLDLIQLRVYTVRGEDDLNRAAMSF